MQGGCPSQSGAQSSPRGDPSGWHVNLPLGCWCSLSHVPCPPDSSRFEGLGRGGKPPSHQSSPSLPGLTFAVHLSCKMIAPSLLLLLARRFASASQTFPFQSRACLWLRWCCAGAVGWCQLGRALDYDKLGFITATVRV